jgi:hypothetical protein
MSALSATSTYTPLVQSYSLTKMIIHTQDPLLSIGHPIIAALFIWKKFSSVSAEFRMEATAISFCDMEIYLVSERRGQVLMLTFAYCSTSIFIL